MNRIILLYLIVFLPSAPKLWAHQDFFITQEFGNVKTQILTGFEYEEINKVFIIGVLAEKLSKELSYSEEIFLDFSHDYSNECSLILDVCETDYFLSFDNGLKVSKWGSNQEAPLKKSGIVIRVIGKYFDIVPTLKLLEFGIKNFNDIKLNQNQIEYDKRSWDWTFYSINENAIKKILESEESEIIKDVVNAKIYRPEKESWYRYTYFWQNNNYHIVRKEPQGKETIILRLTHIYDFRRLLY